MKKIPAQVRDNDRITIENGEGIMHFYYEKAGGGKRQYLFTTEFSGSAFDFFRGRGRTMRELYRFRDWGNPRLAKTIERIPSAVAYVVREESDYGDEPMDEAFCA